MRWVQALPPQGEQEPDSSELYATDNFRINFMKVRPPECMSFMHGVESDILHIWQDQNNRHHICTSIHLAYAIWFCIWNFF